ncbi:MAG: PP2C family protein-serine/threonine phosphatase [Acidobacteriota bacterium]|nr:PP2C family protein-serine/threonine phosphatase [Acidobacteriota bacterium]
MPLPAAATAFDVANVVLATFIGTVGLIGLSIVLFRWRRTARTTVLSFGLFCLLYGLRGLARELLALPPSWPSPEALKTTVIGIDYVVAIPLTVFSEQFLGQGWRRSIRILIWTESIYAVLATAFALATGGPGPTLWLNSLLLSLCGPVLIANALRSEYRQTREGRLFVFGLLAFVVVALYPNLLALVHWRMPIDPEPIGLLLFVSSLGYLALTRIEEKERRLVAIEHELETARRIQATILPGRPPSAGGIDIAARYVPMTAVAGDFYDFLPAGNQRLGVLIADVSGHGVGAALIASMLKVALTAQTVHAGDPAAVLGGLNDALCGRFERDYVTAAYLLVDPVEHTLSYAGAGHPPPLVRRPSTGQIEELKQNGLIIGFFSTAQYESVAAPAEPGTRVLLYTDGVIEAANREGEFFGIERLRDFMRRHASLPAGPFADTLLQELGTWIGRTTGHDDDVTLVVVDMIG